MLLPNYKHIFDDLLNFCSSNATTPSVDEQDFLIYRRSSGGVLLSPEIDVSSTSKSVVGEAGENDGFYLLKKDSQRRQTLSKVLTQDEQKICQVWMEKIENDRPETFVLTIVSCIETDKLCEHRDFCLGDICYCSYENNVENFS